MSLELWTAVERYMTDLIVKQDAALDAALAESNAAGLPPISVAPTEGKLLHVLALSVGARNILEIGTLGGYSTIWLARALPPGGRVISLEVDAKHAEVARRNIARAGVAGVVDIRLGKALDTLPAIAAERRERFDLVFVDADKQHNAEYFDWSVRLSRRGTIIIVDNVVRDGAVIDASTKDERVLGTRRFNDALAADRRVIATEIQTVGSKGHDGFAIAVVVDA